VLRRRFGPVVRMTREMHLAVLARNPAARLDEDRCVEAAAVGCQLGIPQVEADTELLRTVEERLHVLVRHARLEEPLDLIELVVPVPREERRQRQLWVNDE